MPDSLVYAIILKLSPEFTRQLGYPGVLDAVADAAKRGQPPSISDLTALGQSQSFANAFVERLGYLLRLREAGTVRAAGPFEGLREGMYLCNAADEAAARRVIEEDPLYQAGFIEREYTVRRWLVAIG
jgi:uncharacterized protein YciI